MAGMNGIRNRAKSLWIKAMKAVGNTAASIASNTRYKVDEMTLQNKRREIRGNLSDMLYSQWMKGEKFSPELNKLLAEMQQIDNQLNDIRAERYAHTKAKSNGETAGGKESQTKSEESKTDISAAIQEPVQKNLPDGDGTDNLPGTRTDAFADSGLSLSNEINECFDHTDSVDRMAEKVNTSLHQLTNKIRSFPTTETNRQKSDKKASEGEQK